MAKSVIKDDLHGRILLDFCGEDDGGCDDCVKVVHNLSPLEFTQQLHNTIIEVATDGHFSRFGLN